MGGKVERDREALLPGGEVAAVEGVGILSRREAGILPDSPGLVDIHGGVGAAQVRRDAGPGLQEIDAFEIGFAIAGFYQNAFGREPRLGAAGRRSRSDGCERDISEIGNAGHPLVSSNLLFRSISSRTFLL